MTDIITQLHLQANAYGYTPTPGNISSGNYQAGALIGKKVIEYILKQDQKTLELRIGDTLGYFAWTGSKWARQGGVVIDYFENATLATSVLADKIKLVTPGNS